jgi:hypothetical protein
MLQFHMHSRCAGNWRGRAWVDEGGRDGIRRSFGFPEGVHFHAVAAKLFGAIESLVGAAEQRLKRQIARGLQRGDAYAEAYRAAFSFKFVRTEEDAQFFGQSGYFLRTYIRQQQRELVSAEAGAMAAWDAGRKSFQVSGQGDEYIVAVKMTVEVVCLLEAIDICQQSESFSPPAWACSRL